MQNYFIKLPASLHILYFTSRGLCFYLLKLYIKKINTTYPVFKHTFMIYQMMAELIFFIFDIL